ncbi:hypothetical protein SUGI_1447090 [Cryptomeria japonica]|uniref:Uncharacterized protein n=1 Tax=Cryptomeria japonica TaxID=3369 RepID=A0AAD3RQU6_CRYJA|nr:hypothetical protein SUGI_1372970 [Cryptomeria japonica]GLJ58413.1 hypothetical protein SUGI_1447090 [Cryptomeria japonica]
MHGVKLKEMRVNPARVNRGSLSKEGLNQGEGQTKVTKMPRLLNHHPFGEGRRLTTEDPALSGILKYITHFIFSNDEAKPTGRAQRMVCVCHIEKEKLNRSVYCWKMDREYPTEEEELWNIQIS